MAAAAQIRQMSKNRLLLFVVLAIIFAVTGVVLKANSHVEAARIHKQLRLIQYHPSKAVCGPVAKGKVRCLAELSLGVSGQPLIEKPASSGSFGPAQFHMAYQLPCTPGGAVQSVCTTPSSFGPETVAIVDAGDFSDSVSGLNTSLADYDNFYGLPACSTSNGCFSVVNQTGAASPLPAEISSGWSDEIVLDVEAAHMMCQTCKVALVEANSANASDLAAAEVTAASLNPSAISNSWSGADAGAYDSDFKRTGMAVVAATGDTGSVGSGQDWPGDIPQVTAASGTTLQINTDNTWAGETVWSDSGGGCSTNYAAPSWQTSLSGWSANGCGTSRAFGDVSIDGDPNTGAAINIEGSWFEAGGTSLSSPLIASIFALAGGVPSGDTASALPYTLFNGSNSHDITSGNDCTVSITLHCTAEAGFDTPSGLGSPNGLSGFASLLSPATNLSTASVTQNQVKLSWSASSSGGVTGYYVYRNNTQIADVTTTSYTDTGLTPNTAYGYYVVAHNSSAGLAGPSIATSVTTYYPEDINGDDHINLLDLSLLANKYGQSGAGVGRADINGDGMVNLLDLSLLANKYGSE